jgi:DNA-binding NtrC family response regulator
VRGTILVVDDGEKTCRLISESLRLEGFSVATARNGQDALRLVESEPPDLIILELALPEMDGIETLRQLRERAAEVGVVILTAYGTVARAREAKAMGVKEFLGKPFDMGRLVRIVADEVEGRGLGLAG